MKALPADASGSSKELYELAWQMAEACPDELAPEIALTGSAARGLADSYSDIELNLWTERMPDRAALASWLEPIGAEDLWPNLSAPDGTGWSWVVCRFQGVYVEVGVAEKRDQEERLELILAGEVTDHDLLTLASMVEDAVSLRSQGWLPRWREKLGRYPDGLAGRIIRVNTSAWSDPHTPLVRWALAQRADRMALAIRLTWDMQNLLRALFAVNGRWETDWKWTEAAAGQLPIKPAALAERIARVFTLSQPHDSIVEAFELILEGLDLVPEEYDVSEARASIQAALEARPR